MNCDANPRRKGGEKPLRVMGHKGADGGMRRSVFYTVSIVFSLALCRGREATKPEIYICMFVLVDANRNFPFCAEITDRLET